MNAMILGACFGAIVTLTFICADLKQRVKKLEKDVKKLLENDQQK